MRPVAASSASVRAAHRRVRPHVVLCESCVPSRSSPPVRRPQVTLRHDLSIVGSSSVSATSSLRLLVRGIEARPPVVFEPLVVFTCGTDARPLIVFERSGRRLSIRLSGLRDSVLLSGSQPPVTDWHVSVGCSVLLEIALFWFSASSCYLVLCST